MSGAGKTKNGGLRKDVQGLRAIAVIAVIFAHLLNWPTGGFLGVDIFFVISGFLITGLLLKEHRRTGKISFANFYRRRIRRIIPLAGVVILVTVLSSYLIFNASRGMQVFEESMWALFFAANWHFANIGTDYWQADGLTSPLQHYWSLAVEEQFYLLWPWLILTLFAIQARRSVKTGRYRSSSLIWVMVGIVLASFVYSLWQSTHEPVWAYFSTLSRAWELAAGAVLAVCPNILGRISPKLRESTAVAGMFIIFAGLILIGEDSGVPAPANALAVIGTVLIIAAGTDSELRTAGYLRNPVMQYVGKISYSLYLWHFPVIVIAGSFFSFLSVLNVVVCLSLTFALSVLSFHFIEDPIRRSTWLEKKPASKSLRWRDRTAWRSAAFIGVAAHGVLTVVVVAITIAPPSGHQDRVGDASETLVSSLITQQTDKAGAPMAEDGGERTTQALSKAIESALESTNFPELTTPLSELGTEVWAEKMRSQGCADVGPDNVDQCITGPKKGQKTAAVLGDSYAIAWMPGIRDALEPLGYSVQALTRGQCPAADVRITKDGGEFFEQCEDHRQWTMEYISELEPDLVILADSDNTLSRLASGADETSGAEEYRDGLEATLSRLAGSSRNVAILSPPPEGASLQECMTTFGHPSDCTTTISTRWVAFNAATKAAAKAKGVSYVQTQSWFCNDAGRCPGFIESIPVRTDTSHLTIEYSRRLAPLLAPALTE